MLYIRLCFVRLRMCERVGARQTDKEKEKERKSDEPRLQRQRDSCYLIITIF